MSQFTKTPNLADVAHAPLWKCAQAILVAAVWLLSACAGHAQPSPPAGLQRQTINVNGVERNYLLYAPQNAGSEDDRRPLVILLHGGGGSAGQIASHVGGGFAARAEREGFYLIVPDAMDRMWDFGAAGLVSQTLPGRADDRAFFEALLDTLPAQLPIDQRRIFATGISRGGQASYFIACSFPGRIRAIAPIAMPLPLFLGDICAHSLPVGVAIINGTRDPLVPYNGGWITIGRSRRDQVLSTNDTIALWRRRNACDGRPPEIERIDRVDDGMHVEKSTWSGCGDAPVVLYRVVGGGHTWPTSDANLPERLVGKINRDIDATREIWAFFSQFR